MGCTGVRVSGSSRWWEWSLPTVVSEKFGFSFSMKSQAARSARVLLQRYAVKLPPVLASSRVIGSQSFSEYV